MLYSPDLPFTCVYPGGMRITYLCTKEVHEGEVALLV